MDNVTQLQKQMSEYTTSLFDQGILNNQFKELRSMQGLQDESNPDFMVELVTMFFEDSEKRFDELSIYLQQENVDFKGDVYYDILNLRESSYILGAQKLNNASIALENSFKEKNAQGCLRCLQEFKSEYCTFKDKIETLFKLEQEIEAANKL